METCYFDRNIFDHIDRKHHITDADIGVLRKAVARKRIAVLVSLETVQETTYARSDTALRGLRLIAQLSRLDFPIKPHGELIRDEIKSFSEGKQSPSPFVSGRFSIDSVIADLEQPTPAIITMLEEDKRNKHELNAKLKNHVEGERRALAGQLPRNFEEYWNWRSTYWAEAFAHGAGYLDQCREAGIEALLKIRSVRISVGAVLSLLYALMIERRAIKPGTSRDLQHSSPMSAADIVVTNDGPLRGLLERIPINDFRVLNLRELIGLVSRTREEVPE